MENEKVKLFSKGISNGCPCEIEVFFSKYESVSRLITGFHLMELSHLVKCSYYENLNNAIGVPSEEVVEIRTCGKRIAFDMGDRSMLHHDIGVQYLNDVDMYFERSHEPEFILTLPTALRDKVRPFGFNYYVTYPGNPVETIPKTLQGKLIKKAKQLTGYSRCMYVDAFEKCADYKEKDLRIIFMARLWDPEEIRLDDSTPTHLRAYREYMREERQQINRDRIAIIRALRKEYGDRFVGGIQHNAFSEKCCSDILLPVKLTRKKHYLSEMQRADICIGSTGLHKSIGWKTGEYVASSRAIVAERLCYCVPGDFAEDENYLPFDCVDECLCAVDKLYRNPMAVYQMKQKNEKYYWEYLRPEQQIMNALRQCGCGK